MVKLLVARGADLTIRDRWGNTPLDIALADDSREIIALLKK